ncbi:hypothetical protein [Lactiplantibacillus plantarum]|uniref:hypothetical protein n=1 Tax=Lactiplantibacillus plantarum TaxID=1590 RepID=UPI001BA7AAB9|nr:hypothetical protein [Lactiplantibacillus plantarum]MBS0954988.1 hypothetical protein [Lactiplantibacillus plantarum]
MTDLSISNVAIKLGKSSVQVIDALNNLGVVGELDSDSRVSKEMVKKLTEQNNILSNLIDIKEVAFKEHFVEKNLIKFFSENTIKRRFMTMNCFLSKKNIYINRSSLTKLVTAFLASSYASATVLAPQRSRFYILEEVMVDEVGLGRIVGFKKILGVQYYDVALYNKNIIRTNSIKENVLSDKPERIPISKRTKAKLTFKIDLEQIQDQGNSFNLSTLLLFGLFNQRFISKQNNCSIFLESRVFGIPTVYFRNAARVLNSDQTSIVDSFCKFVKSVSYNDSIIVTTNDNGQDCLMEFEPVNCEPLTFYVSESVKNAVTKTAVKRGLPTEVLLSNIFSMMELYQTENEEIISLLSRINDYALKGHTRGV